MSGNPRDYYYSSTTSKGSRSTRKEDEDRDCNQDLPRLRDVLREQFDEPYHPAYDLQRMNRALDQAGHSSQPGLRLPPIRETPSRLRQEDYEYDNRSPNASNYHHERPVASRAHNPSRTQPQASYHVLAPTRGELVPVTSSYTRPPGIVREHVITAGQSHNDDPRKRFECDVCGRRMERHSVYTQHMLTHTDERPHVCTYCPKKFNSKSNLNRHMSTHGSRGRDDEDAGNKSGEASSSKNYYSSSRRA